MRVIVAKPRGFCAGVQRAIDILDLVLRLYEPPIYVKHEIVHNKRVVDSFREKGVEFVESCLEVPKGSVIVMSAHGVAPTVRKEAAQRNLRIIDATCPLVAKVHLEAQRFAKEGFIILYPCHKNHPEAIGVMGEVPSEIIFPIENMEDIEHLPPHLFKQPCVLLTQTTLSVQETQSMIDELRRRCLHLVFPPKEDICYATTNRQQAVERLSKVVDMVIVIGSIQSSNSNRLVEVARENGVQSFLIDEAKDLDTIPLEEGGVIGLTSGASAPEELVEQCVEYFKERGAHIETMEAYEENVSFTLPIDLVEKARAQNIRHRLLDRHKPGFTPIHTRPNGELASISRVP